MSVVVEDPLPRRLFCSASVLINARVCLLFASKAMSACSPERLIVIMLLTKRCILDIWMFNVEYARKSKLKRSCGRSDDAGALVEYNCNRSEAFRQLLK